MAEATVNDCLSSSEEDRQIQIPERDLTELLMHLLSSFGETQKLKAERDQLQQQLYQGDSDANISASDIKIPPETGQNILQDKHISTWSPFSDASQWSMAGKQAHIPGSGVRKSSWEIDVQGSKNQVINPTDSGMGSESDISANVCNPNKRAQKSHEFDWSFSGSKPNILSLSGNGTSKDIDVGSVSPNRQFEWLNKSSNSDLNIECDGALGPPPLISFEEEENVFWNQSPQLLQRACSLRQDDHSSDKRKNEMKKTISHESSLQPNAKPDYGHRKFSYSALSSRDSRKALHTSDKLMISCLPQVASRTILNKISLELQRVKKENYRLVQREEEMLQEIYSFRGILEDMHEKLAQKEKAFEELRQNSVDPKQAAELHSKLNSTQTELEKVRKRCKSLENMLEDERKRFARDEKGRRKQKS